MIGSCGPGSDGPFAVTVHANRNVVYIKHSFGTATHALCHDVFFFTGRECLFTGDFVFCFQPIRQLRSAIAVARQPNLMRALAYPIFQQEKFCFQFFNCVAGLLCPPPPAAVIVPVAIAISVCLQGRRPPSLSSGSYRVTTFQEAENIDYVNATVHSHQNADGHNNQPWPESARLA